MSSENKSWKLLTNEAYEATVDAYAKLIRHMDFGDPFDEGVFQVVPGTTQEALRDVFRAYPGRILAIIENNKSEDDLAYGPRFVNVLGTLGVPTACMVILAGDLDDTLANMQTSKLITHLKKPLGAGKPLHNFIRGAVHPTES